MQRMQVCNFKFRERRNDWKCCFCCHVRTGTIFFGIWHLMLHVLALSVIAVVLSHPELMTGPEQQNINAPPVLPTPLSEVDFENDMDSDIRLTLGHAPDKPFALHPNTLRGDTFGHRSFDYRKYRDLNVGVVITFCTFIITLLMVFGAIKGKPSYLMPFFCLQVFDFCISSLTAIGYICYLPDMHRVVTESPRVPFQRELLRLNPQCLSLLILLTFMLAMLVKAYFIGVVWSCYKYLTLRQVATQRTIHYIDTDVQTLLPDYETAVKKFPHPPPSYAHAMAGQTSPPSQPSDNISPSV